MFFLKGLWYRTFQTVFGLCSNLMPWRQPELIEGVDSIKKLPALLAEKKVGCTMIVTDKGLMSYGVAPKVLKELDDAGAKYVVFDDVEPNPSVDTVNKIQKLYIESGCSGFVAIGGGSPMDAAKGAAGRVLRPRRSVQQLGGLFKVLKRMPPFIAIPTTSGSGSETTLAAVITDRATHHKYAMYDISIIPHYAILDPTLTAGLPKKITSTTGMDALTHAVEGFLCVRSRNPKAMNCAKKAVPLIFANLEKCYEDGSNLEAREAMQIASFNAGYAFTRSAVGYVHTIAHTLGGLYDTPHGLANAVILPIVLEDYGKKVWRRLGILYDCAGMTGETTNEGKAKAFIAEIRAMNKRMDIPESFDHIKDEDVEQMITWALKEANPLYPVPVLYDRKRCRAVIAKIRTKKED